MEIDYNNVEKYIQGELTGNELAAFEVSLEKDEALQKKVHFYQYAMSTLADNKIYTAAEEEKIAKINPILAELRDQYFIDKNAQTETSTKEAIQPKSTVIKRLFPLATLAAAAALLIFFLLPQLQNQSNVEIAANNFEMFSLDNRMGDLEETQKNYINGNFVEAGQQLTDLLKELPNSPDLWLAKGCTKFKLNEIDEAINSFEKAIEIDDSGISHPYANWYIALCYLNKDDRKKAIHHLNKIQKNMDKFSEAKQLLRQLQ